MPSLAFKLRQSFLEKMIRFYGPYLGSAIRPSFISADYRHIKVEMDLTFYNKNYMGTQFGGSLYAMVDPWYMLMLYKNLGDGYIVWDKAATINFRKPGTGKVFAEFTLSQEVIEAVKAEVAVKVKMDQHFHVEIKDASGKLIAEVDKVVYVRKKTPEGRNKKPS